MAAALHIHNALFTPENSPISSALHSPSTISSPSRSYIPSRSIDHAHSITTPRTSESYQSHPTEHLLETNTSESFAYLDPTSRQPLHSDRSIHEPMRGQVWGQRPDDSLAVVHPNEHDDRIKRRKIRIFKITRVVIEICIGIWATYNIVRYFLAFTTYSNLEGLSVSLALAMSSIVSTMFMILAISLSFISPHTLFRRGRTLSSPKWLLRSMRILFCWSSCFFLLSPAVVNFALLFVWRNSSYPQLRPDRRCDWSIDIVWSITESQCIDDPSPFGVWVTASAVRLGLTLIFIVIYLSVFHLHRRAKQPFMSPQAHGDHVPCQNPPFAFLATPPQTEANLSRPPSALRPALAQRTSSGLTKSSGATSSTEIFHPPPLRRKSSRLTKVSRPSSASSRASASSITIAGAGSRSSHGSGEDAQLEWDPQSLYTGHRLPESNSDPSVEPLPLEESKEFSDVDLSNFADCFRSLVAQVSRETDDGLRFAQADNNDDIGTTDPTDQYTIAFPLSQEPEPLGPYDFPALRLLEERIPILGGFIQRMPTIESVGSREASVRTHLSSSISRPPTRATILSLSQSQPSSRSNSLNAAFIINRENTPSTGSGSGSGPGSNSAAGGNLQMNEGEEMMREAAGASSQLSFNRSLMSYYSRGSTGTPLGSPIEETFYERES